MNVRRLIGVFSLGLFGALSLGLLGCWLVLASSLPQTSGALKLPGLESTVLIVRDLHGIPTIQAKSRHDAYMALGFVHAQDRLFQMDLQRRVGAGRLSEIFGPGSLRLDRLMRTLGLYLHAERSVSASSLEFNGVLQAYAQGVNAFLDSDAGLPVEFWTLRYRPERWTPADTLVIGKLLNLQLAGNYRRELLRAKLASRLSPSELGDLFPDYPADAPITLHKLAELTASVPLTAMLDVQSGDSEPARASNNWVVDGRHSVSGYPLLANDPHLDFSSPITWYLARLQAPQLDVAGATIPGVPVVALGHNRRIAWGYTTTDADVEDLFVERPLDTDPARYLAPGGSLAFKQRRETIPIKGRASETLVIRTSRHGPIISDITGYDADRKGAVALCAAFFNDDDRSVEGQWLVNLAHDWTSWRDALRLLTGPPQNMVYADVDGTIGFKVPGHIPIRNSGDGRAPVDGSNDVSDWKGFVPFDALPELLNPPIGHIATANNRIVDKDYPYLITNDWDAPFRITRIEALLAAQDRQSLVSSSRMQQDVLSLSAQQLLPVMLRLAANDGPAEAVLQRLRQWDFQMEATRPEPLIYEAWLREFDRALFKPKLAELYGTSWAPSPLVTLHVLRDRPAWCGSPGCAVLLDAALARAITSLKQQYGDDVESWRWGNAHMATFQHPIFQHIAVLGRLFDRRVASAGAFDTINAGGFHGDGPDAFADVHGPGLRAIYDLADLDGSRFQIALGQSAHILSPHYDDMQVLWRRGEGTTIPSTPSGETLTLHP